MPRATAEVAVFTIAEESLSLGASGVVDGSTVTFTSATSARAVAVFTVEGSVRTFTPGASTIIAGSLTLASRGRRTSRQGV